MAGVNENESLNVPKSVLNEFFDDVEGKLAMLAGLVNYENFGLTLDMIRKPLLVIGPPGIGKTCGIISSIREMNKKLPAGKQIGFKKILLGQTVVGSLTGIPVSLPSGEVVRVQMPDLPDPKRDGEVGVLFLDEITTADEMQIQPALGLADDSRSLGAYTLPEKWCVIGAGNGPDCTNFVRLDDMTISRFLVYDISYDYKHDFRPYAHSTGLHEDIIAFLNFDESMCVHVESTDMDEAGKQFPCPRTWERLSIELKMREAAGKPVDASKMENFAGRIIGKTAGRKFSAFMQFKKNLKYDFEKIMMGTERKPESGLRSESFHIILEGLIKRSSKLLADTKSGEKDWPLETYKQIVNMFNWILDLDSIEHKLNAINDFRSVDDINLIMFDQDFCAMCPRFDEFFVDNNALIQEESIEELLSVKA